jgi:hypothetical protein
VFWASSPRDEGLLRQAAFSIVALRTTTTITEEETMRSFLLIAAALLAFGATMTFESTDANAVVCARGVYRAGCAGYRGAVVVRKPVRACRSVLVNGVYVRRCY